ncbi:MAG: protein kinase [Verrucomicrobiales bacterium]|nr:protein kinase [Verrucomicrobiales bacterium]
MTDNDAKSEETIFSAALQCAPDERAAFLDRACAGQPELRQRLEALLQAQLQLADFMESPLRPGELNPLDVKGVQAGPEEVPGTRIGHYKLLQKIGEGGCGVVYLAEQEQPVRRRVAVKVLKPGMDTKSVIARFEAERQALALMDHPNIAKVLDAGATKTGRPYFVMELVRGTRITTFCEENKLSLAERLALFIQVCQAVQHAHQKGIIHRDLKPSNILVTIHNPGAPGVPVIIDFGIAKATQGRLTDQTLFTALEEFLGTPAYMSPEQAMMTTLDIDTRSDIYSLGVLLYELLTGTTPFDTKELLKAGFDELRRVIREVEPPTPNTRLTQRLRRGPQSPLITHHSSLSTDLDWIVMKCLEKDRRRRYETADALATDLYRHLQNEPILARPPSRLYEFQKSVRRHRFGFGAALAVLIALAIGILLTSREAARARRAEQQTRLTAYVADMDLANRSLAENDLGAARNLLRRHLPSGKQADLRNWEWRYLADACEGDPHHSLTGHVSPIWSLRFVNATTLLTAGQADWRTILWSLDTRRPSMVITNLHGAGGVSPVMAVSPKRNRMFYRVGWRYASKILEVNLEQGTEATMREPNGHVLDLESGIESLDVSPDEQTLAIASGNEVVLVDLDGKTPKERFTTEQGAPVRALFSPDGERLVIADRRGHIAFWERATHRNLGVIAALDAAEGLWALTRSRDGRWLASPDGKQGIQIWNADDRTRIAVLEHPNFVERVAFSPDRKWLAAVGGDSTVRLWDTTTWRNERRLRGHTDSITSLDFSPDGHWLATGTRSGEVKLWPLSQAPIQSEQISLTAASFFELAADGSGFGRILKSGSSNNVTSWSAELWSTQPLKRIFSVPLPGGEPSSGVVLGGGRGIVLGGFDGNLRFLSSPTGAESVLSNAHAAEIYLLDVSMDGSTLASKALADSAMPEGRIRIWRLPQMEQIAELRHAENVHTIKLSDDGHWLAGFTGPGDMGVWEIPSMKGPPMWQGIAAHQRSRECAFSPDNRWFAAATPDGGAFVWDLSTHQRRVLPRAVTRYTSLSFSPDGTRLAAGSEGEGKLFDTATSQVVLSFQEHGLKLAFARDGERLLAVHEAGASVFHAPAIGKLQFDWLKVAPSAEAPPYRGPDPDYVRPDRF